MEIRDGDTVTTKYGTRFLDVQSCPSAPIPHYYSGVVDKPTCWSHGTRAGFTIAQVRKVERPVPADFDCGAGI